MMSVNSTGHLQLFIYVSDQDNKTHG